MRNHLLVTSNNSTPSADSNNAAQSEKKKVHEHLILYTGMMLPSSAELILLRLESFL
jgi:hypothetical protein